MEPRTGDGKEAKCVENRNLIVTTEKKNTARKATIG